MIFVGSDAPTTDSGKFIVRVYSLDNPIRLTSLGLLDYDLARDKPAQS